MPKAIPPRQRERVKGRERLRCFRCGAPTGEGQGDWHHRRSRSVRDEHQHCTCNGVWLCQTCHDWVHSYPFDARGVGLIVSRHQKLPGSVPATSYFGPLDLGCTGKYKYHEEQL